MDLLVYAASLRSAEGASLRSAGWGLASLVVLLKGVLPRFARLGLASLGWGSLRSAGVRPLLKISQYRCLLKNILKKKVPVGHFETHYRYLLKMRQPATRSHRHFPDTEGL
jgi:hypothetical protein